MNPNKHRHDFDENEIYPSTCVYGCGCWVLIFVAYSIALWIL